jgi:hypothetical protein
MAYVALRALAAGAVALAAPEAADPRHPLCRVFLHEEQRERDDLARELTLARTELTALEEIFTLIDGLWKIQGIERLAYQNGKHDRDLARIDVERLRLEVDRQDAYLEQYRTICEAPSADARPTAEQSATVARAWERYLRADCGILVEERRAAEVDLDYRREIRASVHDLREGDVATRPDLIRAELGVRTAEQRLDDARRRAERCRP